MVQRDSLDTIMPIFILVTQIFIKSTVIRVVMWPSSKRTPTVQMALLAASFHLQH
jgi:hypothetical protein